MKKSTITKYKVEVEKTETYEVHFELPDKDDDFAKQYAFAAVNDYEDRDERYNDSERIKNVKEMSASEKITIL